MKSLPVSNLGYVISVHKNYSRVDNTKSRKLLFIFIYIPICSVGLTKKLFLIGPLWTHTRRYFPLWRTNVPLNYVIYVHAAVSNLLYTVYQHLYITGVRSNSRVNESWKILFQFYRTSPDRRWLSDLPKIHTTEKNSKLNCKCKFFNC